MAAGPVSELVVRECPIAVIAATTTWPEFAGLWRVLLDEVWATVRAHPSMSPGRNVMLYKDDVPNVEVGVEIDRPFTPLGRLVYSTLPAGRVAMTTHRGAYEAIGVAHHAVKDECDRRGLHRLGPRWEIYGHHTPVIADQEVEVYYLLG